MPVHAQMSHILQACFCLQACGRLHIIAKPYKPSVAELQIFSNGDLITMVQSQNLPCAGQMCLGDHACCLISSAPEHLVCTVVGKALASKDDYKYTGLML